MLLFRDVGTNFALAASTRGVFPQTEGLKVAAEVLEPALPARVEITTPTTPRLKARWQKYGTPVLVVLLEVERATSLIWSFVRFGARYWPMIFPTTDRLPSRPTGSCFTRHSRVD